MTSPLTIDEVKALYGSNLRIMEPTVQLKAMHTIIRDAKTSRNDFVFYCDRLIRLLVEEGLNLLPFVEKEVTTPTGSVYSGLGFTAKLCGVSIMRAGESMEIALRDTCKNVRIGKILIQRDESSATKEPKLYYCKVPHDIGERCVILMDPMIATGGSAIMAIDSLIERGVKRENLIFLSVVSCPEGIHNVLSKHPGIKIVTTMVDPCMNSHKYILPGLGDFGDRYFGTE